jgi:hypothetical protein
LRTALALDKSAHGHHRINSLPPLYR